MAKRDLTPSKKAEISFTVDDDACNMRVNHQSRPSPLIINTNAKLHDVLAIAESRLRRLEYQLGIMASFSEMECEPNELAWHIKASVDEVLSLVSFAHQHVEKKAAGADHA